MNPIGKILFAVVLDQDKLYKPKKVPTSLNFLPADVEVGLKEHVDDEHYDQSERCAVLRKARKTLIPLITTSQEVNHTS